MLSALKLRGPYFGFFACTACCVFAASCDRGATHETRDPLVANEERFEFDVLEAGTPQIQWQTENPIPLPSKPIRRIGRLALGEQLESQDDPVQKGADVGDYYGPATQWLSAHQRKNGAWHFDGEPVIEKNAAPAKANEKSNCPNAATALTVTAFQTIGETHLEGSHKEIVKQGLSYLLKNMRVEGPRGAMSDDAMPVFSHALATQAICQGYAMTNDRQLMFPSQMTLRHLLHLQEKEGGWPDDGAVFKTQPLTALSLLAMKEGHRAELEVPIESVRLAGKFIDNTKPQQPGNEAADRALIDPAWILSVAIVNKRDDRDWIREQLDALIESGPQRGEMQTNYFITRAIIATRHHKGWQKWSKALREQLLADQAKDGDDDGSWHYKEGEAFNRHGGRLYCTALALILLRHCDDHRPFRMAPVDEDDFPL